MIDILIDARRAPLTPGLEVARILPFHKRRHGPPLHLSRPRRPRHTPTTHSLQNGRSPHPHIGISTVTYLFHGKWMHRDSVGYEQVIRPGDIKWMTAGSGVSHSERYEEEYRKHGGEMELLQAWVALPEALEETEPPFTTANKPPCPTPSTRPSGTIRRLVKLAAIN